jgi:hypothetical protein
VFLRTPMEIATSIRTPATRNSVEQYSSTAPHPIVLILVITTYRA